MAVVLFRIILMLQTLRLIFSGDTEVCEVLKRKTNHGRVPNHSVGSLEMAS